MTIPIGLAQSPPRIWYNTYGGTGNDEAHCIVRTNDGGYAFTGLTNSFGLGGNRGWLVKTDSSGRVLWNKTYGSSESTIWSAVQTSDGGYALAGSIVVPVGHFNRGVPWLIKTYADGNETWEKEYTGLIGWLGNAGAHSIVERAGGGFVLGGLWEDIVDPPGGGLGVISAFWMVTDASGNITNSNVYGPNFSYSMYWDSSVDSIIHANEGGYFLSGRCGGFGEYGFGLWKIDEYGNLTFGPRSYGGVRAYSLAERPDGRILLVGYTTEGLPWARTDYPYFVLTDSNGNKLNEGKNWPLDGRWEAVIRSSDGGYAFTGHTKANGMQYSLLLKTDSTVITQWSNSWQYLGWDAAYSLVETSTGGFVLAGTTKASEGGNADAILLDFGPQLAVTINPPGVAMYVGNSILFSSQVSGGTPSYSYQWYLNDTAVTGPTSSSWNFTPTSVSYYIVQLQVTDNNGTIAWSNKSPVSVGNNAVSIYPVLVTMDLGQVQAFSSNVSGGTPPYSYKWFLNDSEVLGATSFTWSFSPTVAGNYTIFLQVTDDASLTRNSNHASVTVNPDLTVSINPASATTIVNVPQVFSSTVSGGTPPYDYEWFANGTLVPGATSHYMSFGLSEVGVYNIYLNVTDAVGVTKKSNDAWLAVHAPPVANFTWSPLVPMVGDVVTFNGSSSTPDGGMIVSYAWDFGDGGIGSGETATHAYSAWGNYTVTLNVTDNEGLWAIEQQQIQVVPKPLSVSISPMSASIYLDESVTFTSTVSGGYQPYRYQWYLDGNPVPIATLSSWTFMPTSTGIHYVYLSVTDNYNYANQSDTARIVVLSPPVGGYSISIEKNAGSPAPAPYFALLAALTIGFTTIRRKTKRRTK